RRRSTLPKRQWATPPAMPVATFARLTVLDTAVGVSPATSRIVDDVGPNPMPSAPSTSEATNPASATSTRASIANKTYWIGEEDAARPAADAGRPATRVSARLPAGRVV